jgi:hypothetical protein
MRNATSLGIPMPSKTQIKSSEHLGWCYHPSSIYKNPKVKTNLENKKFDIFSKISKLSMKEI